MSFVSKTWLDDVSGNTPITAADLNRIEQGILGADNTAAAVGGSSIFRVETAEVYTGTTLVTSASLITPSLPIGEYMVEVSGIYLGSTTLQALRAAILHSGTVTNIQAGMIASISGTTSNNSFVTANGGALGVSPTASSASLTTYLPFQITSSIKASTAGTIAFRGASSTTGSITVGIGTYMRVTRIL